MIMLGALVATVGGTGIFTGAAIARRLAETSDPAGGHRHASV
ncbi:MAG TPA: hypothetical protein VMQ65_01700 [Candidatus Limnocylindria bacterium]|nr:hypothetical protein [Candidatus Limnocylindria bacterium]